MCPELANGNRTGARSPERGLLEIANNGKLAVVQAVGYPTPNLSHFTSRDIWYSANVSASVTTSQRTGWLGRHAALYGDKQNALDTVSVGGAVNLTLYAEGAVSATPSTPTARSRATATTNSPPRASWTPPPRPRPPTLICGRRRRFRRWTARST
jgi:uncharacterized protein (DUF1501 family)